MNVYLLKNDEWEYQSTFHYAGTSFLRKMGMALDVSEIHQHEVRVKLECAHKVWEIDQVGLTSDWTQSLDISEVEIVSAVDQDGRGTMREIADEDDVCREHVEDGDFTKITTMSRANKKSTVVVEGIGYYHHETVYDQPTDLNFIMALRKKDGLQNLSVMLDEYFSNYRLSHASAR